MILPFIPVESFLDPVLAADVWPRSIAVNEIFLSQLERHKELNKLLNELFNSLSRPDIPLETAIDQGCVTEEQAAGLYTALSGLLERDRDYRRLILYFPFELLPNKTWHHFGEKLQKALERFGQIYMEAWKDLLFVHDVRANFVDGDVLEVERRVGDLPRVVKAAHLIPKLVENGLLAVEEAIALMENSDDQTLRDSIAAALSVLADLGVQAKEPRVKSTPIITTLLFVQAELDEKFSRIEAEDLGHVVPKRKTWLTQKKKQETIEDLGEDISAAIVGNRFASEMAEGFLAPDAKSASRQVLIEGILKAVEFVASADFRKAQALYGQYKGTLLGLWENDDLRTRETLSKTFRRFREVGIIRDEQLAELNIVIPKLAGPFSENLEFMREEMGDIRAMVASIESNLELSRLIYPVVLVFGSRLNGYGERSADIDLSVCVRPGTPFVKRATLKELLRKTFAHRNIRADEIVEFWLEKKGGRITIRDFAEPDVSLGASYWTHILFGAAWEGNQDAVRKLCEKLLVPYMHTDETIEGRDARSLYLESLEQGTLQYRLMHKGYERFFPPYGGIHTPHADKIDGDSMFWDSGYRQLATRLFVSRVFLPKIPIHKN